MRVVSYRKTGEPGVGVMVDDESFVALPNVAPDLPRTLRGVLELGDGALDRVREAASGKSADTRFDDVILVPVIPEPHAIWALALNFKRHIEETGLTTSPDWPHIFLRTPASQVGHLQPILCPHPDVAKLYDYEGELAVIIGRPGRHIPVATALDHVAGYSCYNEGSVREFQGHNRQFGLGKNFERSGAFGPWMMTADELGNPAEQSVITRLNGTIRQNSELSDMLFSVEQVIHYLSTGYTLRPGDVIVMGTPGALPPAPGEDLRPNASDRIPGRVHMRPGDVVTVEITGLGVLENPVVGDEAPPR
jgi:2-keto-4-pentenoate hydratase/2-oxohepta-3-ene-1,7-dioic acid hydratase in catechol pathway